MASFTSTLEGSHDLYGGLQISPFEITAAVGTGVSFSEGEICQCADGKTVSKITANTDTVGAVCLEAVTGGTNVRASFALRGVFKNSKIVYPVTSTDEDDYFAGARMNGIILDSNQ